MTIEDYRYAVGLNREMVQLRDSMYLSHLKVGLDKHTKEMQNAKDEVQFRWLQGKVQLLSQLVAEIESARDNLKKLEEAPPQATPPKY